MPSEDFVRSHFAPWESDNPISFFDTLPDNVSWIITGKLNPKSGHYNSRAEVLEVFGSLMSKLSASPTCKITNVLTSKDYGVIEMDFHAVSKGGNDFDQDLCWVCRYEGDKCVAVKLYVDTAAEKQLFEEP
jgi:ketosteroid isomerase-like protein